MPATSWRTTSLTSAWPPWARAATRAARFTAVRRGLRLRNRLAGVDADADAHLFAAELVVGGERLLHGDGALEGAGGRIEGGHEAVAQGLRLGAGEGGEGAPGDALVLAEDVAGTFVAEALREGRRAFHVGEEDGAEGTAWASRWVWPGSGSRSS